MWRAQRRSSDRSAPQSTPHPAPTRQRSPAMPGLTAAGCPQHALSLSSARARADCCPCGARTPPLLPAVADAQHPAVPIRLVCGTRRAQARVPTDRAHGWLGWHEGRRGSPPRPPPARQEVIYLYMPRYTLRQARSPGASIPAPGATVLSAYELPRPPPARRQRRPSPTGAARLSTLPRWLAGMVGRHHCGCQPHAPRPAPRVPRPASRERCHERTGKATTARRPRGLLHLVSTRRWQSTQLASTAS